MDLVSLGDMLCDILVQTDKAMIIMQQNSYWVYFQVGLSSLSEWGRGQGKPYNFSVQCVKKKSQMVSGFLREMLTSLEFEDFL